VLNWKQKRTCSTEVKLANGHFNEAGLSERDGDIKCQHRNEKGKSRTQPTKPAYRTGTAQILDAFPSFLPGHAAPVISFPSVKHLEIGSGSSHSAPANTTVGLTAGYAVHLPSENVQGARCEFEFVEMRMRECGCVSVHVGATQSCKTIFAEEGLLHENGLKSPRMRFLQRNKNSAAGLCYKAFARLSASIEECPLIRLRTTAEVAL
jgi:hypothetical protein